MLDENGLESMIVSTVDITGAMYNTRRIWTVKYIQEKKWSGTHFSKLGFPQVHGVHSHYALDPWGVGACTLRDVAGSGHKLFSNFHGGILFVVLADVAMLKVLER